MLAGAVCCPCGSRGADLVALPISWPFELWHWMPYQRDVYPPGEVKLALLNVCFLSSPALQPIASAAARHESDPSIRGWPSSEVFVPTEVVRAGMTWLSLADFGDVSHYDWFPPTLEEDLRPADGDAFLHPVLDRRRYLALCCITVARSGRRTGACTLPFPARGIRQAYMAGGPQWRGKADTAQTCSMARANGAVT